MILKSSGTRFGFWVLKKSIMIKNYIKTAFRAMYRDKWYSLVNIGGLAIGMCITILLSLYVLHETSFDKFHTNHQRIYRLHTHIIEEKSNEKRYPVSVYETGGALVERVPEVEKVARLFYSVTGEATVDNETIKSQGLIYTDTTFFSLFNFPIIQGNSKNPLAQPNNIVITERVASAWFGSDDPIGKSINIFTYDIDTMERRLYKRPQSLTVSAIMKNPPKNSHLQPAVITNFATMPETFLRVNGLDFYTYLKTNRPIDSELHGHIAKVNAETIEQGFGKDHPKEFTQTHVMPIAKIHLHANYQSERGKTANYTFVLTLGIVAALVLLIASINFINLTTARADNRKREVGVRKTVGSSRNMIIAQFIGESVLTSMFALILALMLAELTITPFNTLIGTQLSLDYKHNISLFIALVTLAITIGVSGGLYPALYVSRFNPLAILRGLTEKGKQNVFIKRVLIIFQFGIATTLIFGLIVINSQLRFMKRKDLGFTPQNVVIFFGLTENLIAGYNSLTNDLEAIPNVISVSGAQSFPSAGFSGMNLALEGEEPTSAFSVKEHRVQDNYIETMQMQLVDGRDFRPNSPADNEGYIINETAAKMLGIENPIGARVMMWKRPGKVIGVIKDFHFASLRNNIEPMVISRYNPRMHNLTIRIDEKNKAESVKRIIETITKHEPGYSPSYSYLDDILMAQYGSEEKTFNLILSASIVALILSMIGLYALSAYSLANRTKELGVRKILGANAPSLMNLLLIDTTKWVLVASLVALPAGWIFAKDWLTDFAYRIDISPWYLVLAIAGTYSIALITVTGQILRAVSTNPVVTLRYE